MTLQRMDHVGIVVSDLAAATEFFVELGLEPQGQGSVEGRWVDRIVGLDGVQVEYAMVQTADGNGRLELVKFHSPSDEGDNRHASANTPGIRHVAFAVKDIDAAVGDLRTHNTADTEDIGIVHLPEPVEPDDLVALEHGPLLRITCVVRLGPGPVPYLAEVETDEPGDRRGRKR